MPRVKEFGEDYFRPPRCVTGVGTVWASTLRQEIGHVFNNPSSGHWIRRSVAVQAAV